MWFYGIWELRALSDLSHYPKKTSSMTQASYGMIFNFPWNGKEQKHVLYQNARHDNNTFEKLGISAAVVAA